MFIVSGEINASSLFVLDSAIQAVVTLRDGGNIIFNVGGGLTTTGASNFLLLNSGGTIDSDATINLNAANITANSLFVQIDNSNGGTIGGNATINMNVSGTPPSRTMPLSRFLAATVQRRPRSILMVAVTMLAGRSLPPSTALARSHSIMPAFTQMCSEQACSAQTVCSISAAAPSRLIRR